MVLPIKLKKISLPVFSIYHIIEISKSQPSHNF